MLLSTSEYLAQVAPLLSENAATLEPDEVTGKLVFSMLCEPGDRAAGFLGDCLGYGRLVELLLERTDAAALQRQLTSNQVGELQELFGSDLTKLWSESSQRWLPRLSKSALLECLTWMKNQRLESQTEHWLVPAGGAEYPLGLTQLEYAKPPMLWGMGNRASLSVKPSISIVGARVASRYGTEVARDLGIIAAQSGLVTVSGGAFGIDEAVHRTAVRMGGVTVSYMAGGLANLYPRANLELLLEVAKTGAVVSEQPPWVVPAKWRFLMRNRLIAAHGLGTVIVEAGKTSGALRTARFAIELGRPVAVVPGPINSARSAGCHDLLNEHLGDVSLISRPQDLLSLIGATQHQEVIATGLGSLERRALDSFQSGSLETWEVQRLAGLTLVETQVALGALELRGLVQRTGTRYLRSAS